jgi:hypothetical protein
MARLDQSSIVLAVSFPNRIMLRHERRRLIARKPRVDASRLKIQRLVMA